MSFQYPIFLLGIPLIIWLFTRRTKRTPVTLASAQAWPATRAGRARYLWLPSTLRTVTIVALLVALAHPQAKSEFQQENAEGIAIQILIDVSSSMEMTMSDIDGKSASRMQIAKDMVSRFISGDDSSLQGRPNDLIGLITFARYADTRSPLTFGHDALLQIINNLTIQERPNEDGTAYGDAIAIAAARLQKLEELKSSLSSQQLEAIKSRIIILLTDGENNSGNHLPTEAAGLAKMWGCRIYAISMGEAFNFDQTSNNAATLTDAEKTLEHIAQQTGGIFRKANDSASLQSVYQEIDQLERSQVSTRGFESTSQWFWLPLSLSLLSLFTALLLESTILRIAP